jgi:outer membrane protein OmpA-like peptidoglycan-associated protein
MIQRGWFSFAGLCLVVLFHESFSEMNTEGNRGVLRTISAKTLGKVSMNIGLGMNYAQDNKYLQNVRIDSKLQGKATTRFLTNDVYVGFGLTSFMDLAFALPIFYDKTDMGDGESDGGIGDVALSWKMVYPPPTKPRVFYQSYYLGGTIPTGNKNSGISPRYTSYLEKDEKNVKKDTLGRFYSNDCFTFRPMMAWTFDIGGKVKQFQFQIHINLGGIFSFDRDRNNLVVGSIAMEYAPVDVLSLFVDFAGQSRWANFSKGWILGSDPLMLSPGMKITTPFGLYVLFAGDFGLWTDNHHEYWKPNHSPVKGWEYETKMAPKYGMQFSLGWAGPLKPQLDNDNDGVKNDFDRCPDIAEDKDGFQDEDGCPDYDNDKDGFADSLDKCPNDAEDKDGFEDSDGCPDLDNDKDGIRDLLDQCPDVAEDFDGFEDTDGCPDLDNDKDGIQDTLDKCPNEPEDTDAFEDSDGCPDLDNDKDNIPDLKDKCPNEPETFNAYMDDDGCPDTKIVEIKESNMPKFQILDGVQFLSGSTELNQMSYMYIDQILNEMKQYPTVEIEIRGHTDGQGKFEVNMSLSQARSDVVRMYLINRGIEAARIRAIGFGSTKPVADNRTAKGRQQNRRIEVVRLK